MPEFIKPTVISGPAKEQNTKRKPSKVLLIIAVVFFVLLFVPDPIKLIPVVGEGEELVEGGISMSALMIYAVRYWIYKKIKEQITGK